MLFTKDITDAAGLLQLSAGQEAGVEAVIHTVWDIFANEDTEAVLLIDAENAFNLSIKRYGLIWILFVQSSLRILLTAILHLQDYF